MKIIIYGVGKMAEFIWYCFTNDTAHEVVGFCYDEQYTEDRTTLFGLPVMPFQRAIERFSVADHVFHVAIGQNTGRYRAFGLVRDAGFGFASYLSTKANYWPDLVMGENVFIDQACIIQPFVTIGDNSMLIGARIGHHSSIGNHVLLSGTVLAGNVTIEDYSFLGINSGIKEGVTIAEANIISSGTFINKNTKPNSLIYIDRSLLKTAISKRITLFNR